jgi:KDO2-lipid IV(A) lauroyltransferase
MTRTEWPCYRDSQGAYLGFPFHCYSTPKMNDGIAIPFFGRDAMTAPAIAQLALRFNCPIVPFRAERLGGAHFRLTVYPPLELPRTGNREADIRALMVQINTLLEQWVRARPEQWLWLHRRWPD